MSKELNTNNGLPIGWDIRTFEDLLDYIQPGPYIVESTDYSDSYKTPVLTAGKSFILGKTNERNGIFNDLPVIIFDDFTTANKFVNFTFKVKSSAMKILKPKNDSVNIKFVYYYMQTVRITYDTHKRYWISVFSKLPIPTPQPNTQQAIVSKIEELFSKLDKGIEQLKTAQQQLKTYRQAVLKWAFEGKLTNERVKNGELPEGWRLVKLNEVGKLFCGQSSPVSEVNKIGKGTLYVTGPEQWDGKHIEQTKWTISPKRIVPNGTIFITVKGAGVGKMFPGISCAIGRDVYAYLPSADLNFKFAYYALKHSIDLVIAKAQGDIPGLAKNHILEHEIGICSIEEQERTVQAIESRLSVADKTDESITQSLQQAEALRQSILKKAFEGKLIPD